LYGRHGAPRGSRVRPFEALASAGPFIEPGFGHPGRVEQLVEPGECRLDVAAAELEVAETALGEVLRLEGAATAA